MELKGMRNAPDLFETAKGKWLFTMIFFRIRPLSLFRSFTLVLLRFLQYPFFFTTNEPGANLKELPMGP